VGSLWSGFWAVLQKAARRVLSSGHREVWRDPRRRKKGTYLHPCLFFFLFFLLLGFELRAYHLSHSTNPFLVMGFF
jgi:hypothetical protein